MNVANARLNCRPNKTEMRSSDLHRVKKRAEREGKTRILEMYVYANEDAILDGIQLAPKAFFSSSCLLTENIASVPDDEACS